MSFEFVSYFGFRASSFLFSILGVLCDSTVLTTLSPSKGTFAARPVEFLLDRKYVGFAVKLFHSASHRLSDSLNPNSTENFKYVWLESTAG